MTAGHRVDRAVHAAGPDRAEHYAGHRRPGRVLQCQVGRHLLDRPALARRRLPPLLLGQVFEQVHQGVPLIVDRGPRFAAFHRSSASAPQPVLPDVGYEVVLRAGSVPSWCAESRTECADGLDQGLEQGGDLADGVGPRSGDGELVQYQPGEVVVGHVDGMAGVARPDQGQPVREPGVDPASRTAAGLGIWGPGVLAGPLGAGLSLRPGRSAGGCFDASGLLLRAGRGGYRVRARVALSMRSPRSSALASR